MYWISGAGGVTGLPAGKGQGDVCGARVAHPLQCGPAAGHGVHNVLNDGHRLRILNLFLA